jgi:hypothetical protein
MRGHGFQRELTTCRGRNTSATITSAGATHADACSDTDTDADAVTGPHNLSRS